MASAINRNNLNTLREKAKKIPAAVYSAVIASAAVCGIFAVVNSVKNPDGQSAAIREEKRIARLEEKKRERKKSNVNLLLRIAAAVMERIPV